MGEEYKGTGFVLVGLIVGCCITWGVMKYSQTQTKYKMNLKCIQGELYEEWLELKNGCLCCSVR